MLRWAAFALRPLTINEIAEAVLINEDEDLPTNELPDVVDDDYIGSEILDLCSPLLEVRRLNSELEAGKQTVHLAHFTVKQFLVGRLPTGVWQNETLRASNERIQHTMLARSCLWYIQSRQAWQNNAYGSPCQKAFRDYSATAWHTHVKSGVSLDRDSHTSENIHKFMNEAHPYWSAWKTWFDKQDKSQEILEDDHDSLGPPYHAIRLGLDAVAIIKIRELGSEGLLGGAYRPMLDLCCLQGLIEPVKEVLDAGVNVDTRGYASITPLYSASRNGCLALVEYLLHRGAKISVANQHGWTPINSAANQGHLEIVKLLLERGSDITVATNDGQTPLSYAAESEHEALFHLLFENNAAALSIPDILGRTPIVHAIRGGRSSIFDFILMYQGTDVNSQDHYGSTVLSLAARFGRSAMVQQLLALPTVDVWSADIFGFTALSWARSQGHDDITQSIAKRCESYDTCMTETAIPIVRRNVSTGTDFCDLCLAELGETWYGCNSCFEGFAICSDCRKLGAYCLVHCHDLVTIQQEQNR